MHRLPVVERLTVAQKKRFRTRAGWRPVPAYDRPATRELKRTSLGSRTARF